MRGSRGRSTEDPGSPDFFVREQESLPELHMETGVLVFKTGVRLKHSIQIPEGVRCVLNSRNHQTAELLGKMKISAAACGMSGRDTLEHRQPRLWIGGAFFAEKCSDIGWEAFRAP